MSATPPLVLGRLPVRQARLVLAGAVALAVVAAITVTQIPTPTTVPITGDLHFIDVNGGYSSGLLVNLTGLAAAPSDGHYQAWLVDPASEQIASLGDLTLQDRSYHLDPGSTPPTTANLLANGNEFEVTLEHQQVTDPTGRIMFQGMMPPKAMVHVRHLLVSFPTTPAQVGLLVGLLQQMQILAQQTRTLAATPQAGTLSHCVLLSQLIVIEGDATFTLPAACDALKIPQGDGFGILATASEGYLAIASNHAALALQQPDVTETMHDHGINVLNILANLKAQVIVVDALLRQLLTHFDASQIATVNASVQTLLGTPPGPDAGPPGPPPGAGSTVPSSAFAAYGEGQQMTDFTFTYRPMSH